MRGQNNFCVSCIFENVTTLEVHVVPLFWIVTYLCKKIILTKKSMVVKITIHAFAPVTSHKGLNTA